MIALRRIIVVIVTSLLIGTAGCYRSAGGNPQDPHEVQGATLRDPHGVQGANPRDPHEVRTVPDGSNAAR